MNFEVLKLESFSDIGEYLAILKHKAIWLESINQPMWNIENLQWNPFERKYSNPEYFGCYLNHQLMGGFILCNYDSSWSIQENEDSYFFSFTSATTI